MGFMKKYFYLVLLFSFVFAQLDFNQLSSNNCLTSFSINYFETILEPYFSNLSCSYIDNNSINCIGSLYLDIDCSSGSCYFNNYELGPDMPLFKQAIEQYCSSFIKEDCYCHKINGHYLCNSSLTNISFIKQSGKINISINNNSLALLDLCSLTNSFNYLGKDYVYSIDKSNHQLIIYNFSNNGSLNISNFYLINNEYYVSLDDGFVKGTVKKSYTNNNLYLYLENGSLTSNKSFSNFGLLINANVYAYPTSNFIVQEYNESLDLPYTKVLFKVKIDEQNLEVKNATLTFKIPKKEVLNKSNLMVFRISDDTQPYIPFISEDSNNYYLTINTDGFSIYAVATVGYIDNKENVPVCAPGFILLVPFLFILRKRKQNHMESKI